MKIELSEELKKNKESIQDLNLKVNPNTEQIKNVKRNISDITTKMMQDNDNMN